MLRVALSRLTDTWLAGPPPVEHNLRAACKAVVVSALHEQARCWWLKLGFQPIEDTGLDLYLLTANIERTLGY